jgi:hypothetical protein
MFWHFDMHVKNLGPFSLNAKNDRNSELQWIWANNKKFTAICISQKICRPVSTETQNAFSPWRNLYFHAFFNIIICPFVWSGNLLHPRPRKPNVVHQRFITLPTCLRDDSCSWKPAVSNQSGRHCPSNTLLTARPVVLATILPFCPMYWSWDTWTLGLEIL